MHVNKPIPASEPLGSPDFVHNDTNREVVLSCQHVEEVDWIVVTHAETTDTVWTVHKHFSFQLRIGSTPFGWGTVEPILYERFWP